MENQMEMCFQSLITNVQFSRTAVAAFVGSLNPTIDEIIEIKTIVSEAVSNAIIHGYQNSAKHKVVVKVTMEDSRKVTIIVQDYGIGIKNIEAARVPMYSSLKDLEHAGMGFTIIETLSDNLEVHSTLDLGTKLIISKQLKDFDLG